MVVVDTGGAVYQNVIEFSGSITGLQALQFAGTDPETITYGALGEAVCTLFGVGDPAVPGQCPGGWTYYRSVGGAGGWSQSGLGASNTVVRDGDVEGWKYGGGRPGGSPVFCDHVACAPPAPAPEPAPEPAPPPAPPAGGGLPPGLPAPGSVAPGGGASGSGPQAGVTPGTGGALDGTPGDGRRRPGGVDTVEQRRHLDDHALGPSGSQARRSRIRGRGGDR